MKKELDTMAVQERIQPPVERRETSDNQMDKNLQDSVLALLPSRGKKEVATAHGRLDVMGGIAEYSGAMVLHMPIAQHVACAAEVTPNASITLHSVERARAVEFPFESLLAARTATDVLPIRARLGEDATEQELCAIGTIAELLRHGHIKGNKQGLTLAIGASHRFSCDCGMNAATITAVLRAVSTLLDIQLSTKTMIELSQAVERNWLGLPVGPADAITTLHGQLNQLLPIQCGSADMTPMQPVSLPDSVMLLGIDSGVKNDSLAEKYSQVRIAAFMGNKLVSMIMNKPAHNGSPCPPLSTYSTNDFVEKLRDRLPTKFKGKDFAERFTDCGDPFTTIDPNGVYKIRSRTEHHIYEHFRASSFLDIIMRLNRTKDHKELVQAGDLMLSSHWSYGQRCGLGSVETDILVKLLQTHGQPHGLYGARISGRGCGGVVVVLADNTPVVRSAIATALKEYRQTTGCTATLLD